MALVFTMCKCLCSAAVLLVVQQKCMGGFASCFSKLNFKHKIAVLITTSSNDPADQRRAKKYSMVNNLIVKPITMNKLVLELGKLDKEFD